MRAIKNYYKINGYASSRRRSRGGSPLLITLVVLSILALIATTLTFTSRLEVIASANFAEGIQARMAAVTGIQASVPMLPLSEPYTSFAQRWALQSGGIMREDASNPSLVDIIIEDESAKLNINAADEAFLKSAIASILRANKLDPKPAAAIARDIVAYRHGADGKPGAAGKDGDSDKKDRSIPSEYVDEADEYIPDPSRAPNGDDQPFLSVPEILSLPSMTKEIYDVLRPYLTIYSSCDPIYSLNGKAIEKINPNTASAEDIFQALLRAFPSHDRTLLKQLAVNIVDARDEDSVPTQLEGDSPDAPILGIEKTPYINEVWPDSVTDEKDGDDGQYVELFNPYNESISVEGWEVSAGGSTVLLTGIIAPKGYIVITDDSNNANDPSPEDEKGYGSLYDIFGVVQGGAARRIIEKRDFDIPNGSGIVRLKNQSKQLIDYFAYSGGVYSGTKKSFQRDDPRVRLAFYQSCTPLNKNIGYQNSPNKTTGAIAPFEVRDKLFESPVDIMDVFAGFSKQTTAANRAVNTDDGRTWAVSEIQTNSPYILDIRLVDIFTLQDKKEKTPDYIYGRVNINTAPREILAALPGLEELFIERVEQYRQKSVAATMRGEQNAMRSPFENPSDIMRLALKLPAREAGFINTERDTVLERYKKILPYITVQSRSFTIYSQNKFVYPKKSKETPQEPRNAARAIVRSLIQLTPEGLPQIIDWRFISQ